MLAPLSRFSIVVVPLYQLLINAICSCLCYAVPLCGTFVASVGRLHYVEPLVASATWDFVVFAIGPWSPPHYVGPIPFATSFRCVDLCISYVASEKQLSQNSLGEFGPGQYEGPDVNWLPLLWGS